MKKNSDNLRGDFFDSQCMSSYGKLSAGIEYRQSVAEADD